MGAVGRFTLAHMTQPGWKYNNTLKCCTLALNWHVCGFLIVDQGLKILNPTRSLTLFHLEGEGCLVTASLGKILSPAHISDPSPYGIWSIFLWFGSDGNQGHP